jgi:hypothetical protein
MEPERKRSKVEEAELQSSVSVSRLQIGDEVRLVNLPAYPGLEGLTGIIVGLDHRTSSVDVELKKNRAVKRVCFNPLLYSIVP